MRSVCALACGLLVAGCFNPDGGEASATDGTDSTGDGATGTVATVGMTMTTAMTGPADDSSTASSDPGDTQDPGTTDPTTAADATSGDQPPEVELRVDGSASPPQATHGRRVVLSADASDDGSVQRVEFYDGATLLDTVTGPPYQTAVVVTSLDNATHAFQARAYDDGDQEGLSAVVELEVAITGGATVASDTSIFQTGGLRFNPGGGAVIDAEGNVLVVAPISTTNFAVTGIGALSYAPDLGSVHWQVTEPMSLVDGQPQYLPMGQPFLNAAGTTLLMGGNDMGTDGVLDPNATIFRLDAAGGGPLPFVSVASDPMAQNIPLAGIAVDPQGNVFVHGPDDNIRKYAPDNGALAWESPSGMAFTVSDAGMVRMRADDDGDLITDTVQCDGSVSCTLSTTKINGFDGVVQWSQDIVIPDAAFDFSLGVSTPLADGRVLTVHGPPASEGGGVTLTLRNANGAMMAQQTQWGPETYAVTDVVQDPQGQIVLVGARATGGVHEAWAARVSDMGDVLWEQAFGFGAVDDYALSLATTEDGKIVVVGISDLQPIFVVFNGQLWVALLDL